MRGRLLLAALVVMAFPAICGAQDVPEQVLGWDVEFFAAGVNTQTGSPMLGPINFLKAQAQCGQPKQPVPSGSVLNPTAMAVQDPNDPTKDCVLGPNVAGVLLSVPIGTNYLATLRAKGATQTSARSAPSNPFDRALVPVAPPVPSGVKVR